MKINKGDLILYRAIDVTDDAYGIVTWVPASPGGWVTVTWLDDGRPTEEKISIILSNDQDCDYLELMK